MKKTKIVCALLLLSSMGVVAMHEGQPGEGASREVDQGRGIGLVVHEGQDNCQAEQEDCPTVQKLFTKPNGAEICPGKDGNGFEGIEKGAIITLECQQGADGEKKVIVSHGLSRRTRALLMGQGAALATAVGGTLWFVNALWSAPPTCKPLPSIPDLQLP